MNRKKIIIVALIVIFIVTGFLFISLFLVKNASQNGLVRQISNLFPITKTSSQNQTPSNTLNNSLAQNNSDSKTDFNQITDFDVSDIYLIKNNQSSSTNDILFFVDKNKGNIYQKTKHDSILKLTNQTILDSKRIAVTSTLDKKYNVYIKSESGGLISFFKYKQNYVVSSSTEQSLNTINKLPDYIYNIEPSPINNSSILLTTKINNQINLSITDYDLDKEIRIFSSPYQNWTTSWLSTKNILLSTKPSYELEGNVYSLNNQDRSLTSIIKNVPGLTALGSQSGKYILINYYLNNNIVSGLYNSETKLLEKKSLPLLTSLCTWSDKPERLYCAVPDNTKDLGLYPDDLYKGKVRPTYQLYSIEPASGVQNFIPLPSKSPQLKDIDLIKIDSNQRTIYLLMGHKLYQYDLLP